MTPEIQVDKKKNLLTNPIFVTLAAVFCCALWGSATPAIKTGYELLLSPERDVPSIMLFAGLRFTMAGILTVIIYSIARRKVLYPQKKESAAYIGILALFQTVLQYIFFYIGLANTSGQKGTIMSGCSVFFAILISVFIFRQENLTPKKIIACLLGFAGIVVVNLKGLEFNMNFGDVSVLISAASAGTSSVFTKKFAKHEDPVVLSGYQFILGGIVMILIGLCFGGKVDLSNLAGVGVLVYLAFLSAIAYSLWGILLKYTPVSSVTIFNFMTPVFGVLLSELFLKNDEKLSIVNLIITMLLVCGGIFILNFKLPEKKVKDNL